MLLIQSNLKVWTLFLYWCLRYLLSWLSDSLKISCLSNFFLLVFIWLSFSTFRHPTGNHSVFSHPLSTKCKKKFSFISSLTARTNTAKHDWVISGSPFKLSTNCKTFSAFIKTVSHLVTKQILKMTDIHSFPWSNVVCHILPSYNKSCVTTRISIWRAASLHIN